MTSRGRLRFASARSVAPLCVVALLGVAMAGCNIRDLALDVHAPAECPAPLPDGGLGVEPECPLAAIRSFRTELERVDGLLAASECKPADASLCTYDDLMGYLFLQRSPASEGVEIRITGWSDRGCGGELIMTCESFGESVIDLTGDDMSTPIWCDCPRLFTTP